MDNLEENNQNNKKPILKDILKTMGDNHRYLLLSFLFQYKYSTTEIMSDFLNITKSGIYAMMKRLESENIIKKIKVNENGFRGTFYGLTLSGVYEYCNTEKINSSDDMALFPSDINSSSINHLMAIQKTHISLKKKYEINKFITERTYRFYGINIKRKNKKNIIPDAIMMCDEMNYAIEVETTPKEISRYRSIIEKHYYAIMQNRYKRVIYAIPKRIFNTLKDNIQNIANKTDNEKVNLRKINMYEHIDFIEIS